MKVVDMEQMMVTTVFQIIVLIEEAKNEAVCETGCRQVTNTSVCNIELPGWSSKS